MTVAGTLHDLDQLDAEIEQREAAVLELRRKQQRNSELEALDARLAQLRGQEAAAATRQRTLEGQLSDLEGKIKRDHTRLYSGAIVDSREIGSLERELEHYRAQRSDVEDQLLDAMQSLETLQSQTADGARRATDDRAGWEAGRAGRDRQIQQHLDAIGELRERREPLVAQLDPRASHLYGRLRANSGHAISVVAGVVCQWCRVVIPQKDIQHARSGELATCTNCGRILYPGS